MTRSFWEGAPLVSVLLPWLNPEEVLELPLVVVLLRLPGTFPEPPWFSGTVPLVPELLESLAPRSMSRPVAPKDASTVSLLVI